MKPFLCIQTPARIIQRMIRKKQIHPILEIVNVWGQTCSLQASVLRVSWLLMQSGPPEMTFLCKILNPPPQDLLQSFWIHGLISQSKEYSNLTQLTHYALSMVNSPSLPWSLVLTETGATLIVSSTNHLSPHPSDVCAEKYHKLFGSEMFSWE